MLCNNTKFNFCAKNENNEFVQILKNTNVSATVFCTKINQFFIATAALVISELFVKQASGLTGKVTALKDEDLLSDLSQPAAKTVQATQKKNGNVHFRGFVFETLNPSNRECGAPL